MNQATLVKKAMAVGRAHAETTLTRRATALKKRQQALARHPNPLTLRVQTFAAKGAPTAVVEVQSAGWLVAEGDSWFDYPFHDVLKELQDHYGYDVASVAHAGDPIEAMAYSGKQLDDFCRAVEGLLARQITPKAILLSGGGNDIAGQEFGMLLNHAASAIAGLNAAIVAGVINQRIFTAYVTILNAVTTLCQKKLGRALPILIHGYDYPVPDGRGFQVVWCNVLGPWLDPGFREKGFVDLPRKIALAHDLIDKFNDMLQQLTSLAAFSHVHYINLRGTLSTGRDYTKWWENELHPNEDGFQKVTAKFAAVLHNLPV